MLTIYITGEEFLSTLCSDKAEQSYVICDGCDRVTDQCFQPPHAGEMDGCDNASMRKQVVKVEGWGWAVVPIPQKGMPSLFIMYIDTNLISYRRMRTEAQGPPTMGVLTCSLPSRPTGHGTPPLSRSKRETEGSHCQHPASVSIFEWRRAFHDHTTLPRLKRETVGPPNTKRHQRWCLFGLGST
jgi:hypothetical protein